jgi:hypothetical protein
MRHALIRFLTALDVDAAWYVNLLFWLNFGVSSVRSNGLCLVLHHSPQKLLLIFLTTTQVRSEPLAERVPHHEEQPQYSPRGRTARPSPHSRQQGHFRRLDPQEWTALDSRRRAARPRWR